jgi:hypothetical protein
VRNGAVHILDYKPDARTNKPFAQLTIYALALIRLVPGLRPIDMSDCHRPFALRLRGTQREHRNRTGWRLALKGLTQPVVAYNVPLVGTQAAFGVIEGGAPSA